MTDRVIPCPSCRGEYPHGCTLCHKYGDSGTIPDRRRATPNDMAVAAVLLYVESPTNWKGEYCDGMVTAKDRVLDIIASVEVPHD